VLVGDDAFGPTLTDGRIYQARLQPAF